MVIKEKIIINTAKTGPWISAGLESVGRLRTGSPLKLLKIGRQTCYTARS